MITKIKTKGFLGPDINQKCSPKMVFVGPNRTGKTTRCNAIQLSLNGFVATGNKVRKKAGDILSDYGSGDKLTSAIEINDIEFELHIFKKESGAVSKRFRINKQIYSEKEYMSELLKAGDPRIIDLNAFISMSDEKKIDQLFKLFGSSKNLTALNKKIGKADAEKKRINADLTTKKAVIKENTKSKREIELPAGSLSEIKEDIQKTEDEYRECLKKISDTKAEIKVKAEAEKIKDVSKENNQLEMPSEDYFNQSYPGPDPYINEPSQKKDSDIKIHTTTAMREMNRHPIQSLEKVKETLIESGCEVCVALMVVKSEIRRFEK